MYIVKNEKKAADERLEDLLTVMRLLGKLLEYRMGIARSGMCQFPGWDSFGSLG